MIDNHDGGVFAIHRQIKDGVEAAPAMQDFGHFFGIDGHGDRFLTRAVDDSGGEALDSQPARFVFTAREPGLGRDR